MQQQYVNISVNMEHMKNANIWRPPVHNKHETIAIK